MKKAIVILGPTASGKSSLAVELARKFNGEIVSADSRQVYKGLDIGTGKITRKEMRGIRHYLLDVANPRKRFTVVKFQNLAKKAMQEIAARGKLPIICGGTGFYIQALVDNIVLPDVPANPKLRKLLNKKTAQKLAKILQKLDPVRAKNIDLRNPRRLIRAIEIAKTLGKVPRLPRLNLGMIPDNPLGSTSGTAEFLQIGIKTNDKKLRENITKRLKARIKQGMVDEVKKLYRTGLSWKRMEELGLEYRYLAYYLQGKMPKDEMVKKLNTEIWHYARRQKTWFRKDKRIKWFIQKEKNKIGSEIKKFLQKKARS